MRYSGAAQPPGHSGSARPIGDLGVAQLVTRAQSGSLPCFAELVRRFEGRLLNFVLRRTRSIPDAEDLVQEAFLRAWQRIDQYNPRWQFSTWLYTIAHRLAIAHTQRNRREAAPACLECVASADRDPSRPVADREQCRHIWDLADRILSEAQRSALWLSYAEGLGTKEIARVLGKSQVGVRVTLFRAREALADHLRADRAPRPAAKTKQQLTGELA
ncbi:MAG: RNA polymerase sigma factor, partial [Planctomycetota bacterium]